MRIVRVCIRRAVPVYGVLRCEVFVNKMCGIRGGCGFSLTRVFIVDLEKYFA